MRGLLEIYEQGYTLQQGMKSQIDETNEALGNLGDRCEVLVRDLMTRMENILTDIQKQVDRPANVDWDWCVLPALAKIDGIQPSAIGEDVTRRLNAHTETMLQLEERMEAKLASKIQGMDGSMDHRESCQKEEMEKLREEVRSAQQLSVSLGEHMKQTESELKEAFSNQHRALKTDFAQTVQDVLRLQEKNRRADMAKVEPLLEEQLARILGKHHQNLKATTAKNISDILDIQQEQAKQIADIQPSVKIQLASQFDDQKAIDEPRNLQIDEIHKTVLEDVGHLFNEISVIQRAMNLDYASQARQLPNREETRWREFMTQTESAPLKDSTCQTDDAYFRHLRKKEEKQKQKLQPKPKPAVAEQKHYVKKKSGYADQEKKKAKMREALIKPSYNVANFYYTKGMAQKIARSQWFENVTFFVILANAIWIAVDTDHNNAVVLLDADPVFQISENVFCTFFSIELLIRFLAFKNKRNCMKDWWFVFDSILLVGMILETWVITLILLFVTGGSGTSAEGMGNLSILRMGRLVKVMRMARMARLLRMVPELVVIVKSIGAAFRSVSFFLLLTVIILYVFAVAFKQLTRGTALGDQYFVSVPQAMNSLLLQGMLPLYAVIVDDISSANALYWPIIMSFILLASITVMNMLVGVLVEVVRTVADREREAMTVIHVTNELRDVMTHFITEGLKDTKKSLAGNRSSFAANFQARRGESDTVAKIATEDIPDMSKDTFETFLASPGVISLLQDCGVDAVAILDSVDMIFEEKVRWGAKGLRFVDFVEVVLNMRGTNPATLKDIKEQMRLVKLASQDHSQKTYRLVAYQIGKVRNELMVMLHDLRRLVDSDAGSDDDARSIFLQNMWRQDSDMDDMESGDEYEDADEAWGDSETAAEAEPPQTMNQAPAPPPDADDEISDTEIL